MQAARCVIQSQHAVSYTQTQVQISETGSLCFLQFTFILRGCCKSAGQAKRHALLHMIVRPWLPALRMELAGQESVAMTAADNTARHALTTNQNIEETYTGPESQHTLAAVEGSTEQGRPQPTPMRHSCTAGSGTPPPRVLMLACQPNSLVARHLGGICTSMRQQSAAAGHVHC